MIFCQARVDIVTGMFGFNNARRHSLERFIIAMVPFLFWFTKGPMVNNVLNSELSNSRSQHPGQKPCQTV